VTDHPIIFSAPMVRALLDGRKTQTRRLAWRPLLPLPKGQVDAREDRPSNWQYVHPNDRLWVREACWTNSTPEGDGVRYAADHAWRVIENTPEASEAWCKLDCYGGQAGRDNATDTGMRVPSIHMPRWASRITLHVEALRVEKLQAISAADAVAEGLEPRTASNGHITWHVPDAICGQTPQRAFKLLWESLHGPDAWATNPEVVVLQFRVAKGNIDA
jgi:hypothetical protein